MALHHRLAILYSSTKHLWFYLLLIDVSYSSVIEFFTNYRIRIFRLSKVNSDIIQA